MFIWTKRNMQLKKCNGIIYRYKLPSAIVPYRDYFCLIEKNKVDDRSVRKKLE